MSQQAFNPLPKDQISLAAAHGITGRVIATWNPNLRRTPRVMVPVQLDVLMVRQPGGAWADCQMRQPPDGATTANRRDLLPPPFTNLAGPRAQGAYLHWALPDALTAGQQEGSGVMFRAVPDRWLVLRIAPSVVSRVPRRTVRGWVLRAGDQKPTAVPLDQWVEGPPPEGAGPADAITALGQGDPAWAAYYDNVVNRLGFYDDLSDVSQGPVAYQVIGWYADPTLDPLGDPNIKSLADFDARMAALGWSVAGELHEAVRHARDYIKATAAVGLANREAVVLASAPVTRMAQSNITAGVTPLAAVGAAPAPLDASGSPIDGTYITDGSWWPKLSLYHGAVVGIGWPGVGFPGQENGVIGEVGGPPAAAEIRVAVGATMTEAFGALAARPDTPADEARLLEGFMLGALTEVDQPDGRARLDALLHASSFGSQDGGSRTERIWIPPMPPDSASLPSGPVQPKPGIFPQKPVRPVIMGIGGLGHLPVQQVQVQAFNREPVLSEIAVKNIQGSLSAALGVLTPPPPQPQTPGHYEDVRRSLPRLFYPADPVFLVQGGRRTFKHGGDGRFNQQGRLECRLTGFTVSEITAYAANNAAGAAPDRYAVRADDVLDRGVENGSVPPECEALLHETVLLDPGSAVTVALAANPALASAPPPSVGVAPVPGQIPPALHAQALNFTIEQTAWWAARDPRVDQSPLVALSGLAGTLPSPVGVSLPAQPWNPLHLDWKVQFIPSASGLDDWSLAEIDYQPDLTLLPAAGDTQSGVILAGRAHLTGGAAQTIAAGVRQALAQAASSGGAGPIPAGIVTRFQSVYAQAILTHLNGVTASLAANPAGGQAAAAGGSGVDRSTLADIASALESMDVLAGALDNFHTRLRGNLPGDGVSAPPPDGPDPSPFFPLRAGFLRILRLRLVDGFGQAVDLAGSSDQQNVDPQQILTSQPMTIDGRPDLQALPPRFTSPARLWLRYTDAAGTNQDAGPGPTDGSEISPVCGYLLPDHLDGELKFFDGSGASLGAIRPDPTAKVVWEDAPGQPSTVGQSPERAIPNAFLAGLARGLLDWGLSDAVAGPTDETALSALLRMIDSTLWSVDPFAHTGDEHLALLIGHPVVVLRARMWLELREPVHPEAANRIALPVRLGSLTHWEDGLLGFFVNDDYHTLYCADASAAGFARPVGPMQGFLQQADQVQDYYEKFAEDLGAGVTQGATPVTHPYVDPTQKPILRPNQPVSLTLLVEPHSLVHATAGLLPRKEIGLRREWVAAALAKLSPTFRFGPVLTDLKHIRMPVPNERSGTWSWDHRQDVSDWAEDPVTNATNDAPLSPDPVQGTEGWLRLVPPAPTNGANA